MKKYFLLFLLLPIFIKAQNEITGSVIDKEGNPIPFTDVFLMSESKVMTNDRAITDFFANSLGNFMCKTLINTILKF